MKQPRPFFNFICDPDSWSELLRMIPEENRFSDQSKYVQRLVDISGRPLFLDCDSFDCHVYPPQRDQF